MSNHTGSKTSATWVVVADARRAEIYSLDKRHGPLTIVQLLTSEEARAREQDLVADGPGRAFDPAGPGRHAMEPAQTEKQHVRAEFAQRIAHELAAARKAGRFKQLVIVAAPAMLGELRAHLDAPTASCVAAAFDKEVTGQDPDTILQLIDTQS